MTDFQRLEEIKKILGLSYNKMADVLEMKNPQSFYDIKAGKCGISYDIASRIQEYFKNNLKQDINVDWIINESGSMFKVDATATSRDEINQTGTYNNVHGDNNVNADSTINALIERIKEKDEQISRLITIIEHKL